MQLAQLLDDDTPLEQRYQSYLQHCREKLIAPMLFDDWKEFTLSVIPALAAEEFDDRDPAKDDPCYYEDIDAPEN